VSDSYVVAGAGLVVLEQGHGGGALLLSFPYRRPRTVNPDGLAVLRLLLGEGLSVDEAAARVAPYALECDRGAPVAAVRRFVSDLVADGHVAHSAFPAPGQAIFNRVTTSRPLRRLYLELTRTCDLACAHCLSARPREGEGGRELDTAEVLDLIDQAASLGTMEFDLSGGEPRLRPDIHAVLSHLTSRGQYVTLYTNGAAKDPNWYASLTRYRLTSLVFSVDSILPDIHDSFRGSEGALLRTLRSVEQAIRAGLPLRFNVTLCPETLPSLKVTVDFLRRLPGTRSVVVAPVLPMGRAHDRPDLLYDTTAYGAEVRRLFGVPGPLRRRSPPSSVSPGDGPRPPCGVGESLLFISADGEAGACPTLTASEDPHFALGNVRRRGLRAIWEEYTDRMPPAAFLCRGAGECGAAARCGGGCRSRATVSFGDLTAPDYYSCAYFSPAAAGSTGGQS
jgi:radical SAM protein with 4Fe4S-binding SPASM domain